LNYTKRIPLGVVAQITPWNHPLLITVKKLAPALAAGNCVVVKPSELAPNSIIFLAKMCSEAGLPPGVLNVVLGGGQVGDALVKHPLIEKVKHAAYTPYRS
jgi:acyl-CoA reductase-like NAD-dependent aldehyde dehydrogenase